MAPPLTLRMGRAPFGPPVHRRRVPKHDRSRAHMRYRFRRMAWNYSDPEQVYVSTAVFFCLADEDYDRHRGVVSLYGVGIRVDYELHGTTVRIEQANGAVTVSGTAL